MPGYDRTGPMGEGARTGRALGRCNNGRVNEDRGDWTSRLMQRLRRRRCRRDPAAAMDAGAGFGGCRRNSRLEVEGPDRSLRSKGAEAGFGGGRFGGGRRR